MAEQQQQQDRTPATSPASGHANPAQTVRHPATSMVENMLARGEKSPRAVASIVEAHPAAQSEILELLHAMVGNLFVHEVSAAQGSEAEATASDVVLGPVRITASALRVRATPSTANKKNIVGRLSRGSVVTAIAKDGDWLRIEHDGKDAFIHGDYTVSAVAPPPKAKAEPKGGEEDDASGADAQEAAAPPVVQPPPPVAPSMPIPAPLAPEATPIAAAPPVAATPAPATPDTIAPTVAPEPTPAPIAPPAPTPAQTQVTPAQPTPAPQPAPTPTPAPTPAPDKAPAVDKSPQDVLGGTYKGVFSQVYDTGSQVSQVWVSEGGVSATPNIYIHFHGHRTDYGIDPDLDWQEGGMRENPETKKMERIAPESHRKKVDKGGSGHRAAKEAMAAAQGKNTIAILPQGVLGEGGGGAKEGGYMADIEKLGLTGFLDKILKPLAKDLGLSSLSPGNIGLGGHSAGGYEGVHSAMKSLGKGKRDAGLMDNITDITLFDANYGGSHLDDVRKWMVAGDEGGKNLRLVNGYAQTKKGAKTTMLWQGKVGSAALKKLAAANDMTVNELPTGDKLDNETKVMQHTQLIRKDNGKVQCDVLVLMYSQKGGNDHEALRDRTIDDAIMSIGEGAEGNEDFGRHDKGHLVEKAAELRDEEEKEAAEESALAKPEAPTVENNPLPQPQHVESDERDKPEKITPAPAAEKTAPKAEKKKKRDAEADALRDKLYNEKTGRIRADKLSRKKHITDEEYEFKQLCYRIAQSRVRPDKLYGGCDEDELETIPGTSEKIRKEVLPDLQSLIGAAKAAGHDIYVSSGYRPPEEDFGIWSSAFDRMYLKETKAEREKRWPDDPFGKEAAKFLLDYIKGRKATPGTSNHSNGIAVDFHATEDGKSIPNAYKKQGPWRKSRVFKWLKANCESYNFKNLKTEAWHYDWKP